MRAILLDPHGDDAALFATYTCLRDQPLVLVTHRTVPFTEIVAAARWLRCDVKEIATADKGRHLSSLYSDVEIVYAPEYHDQGHAEHNVIALLARGIWGERVVPYLTYAPRGHRSREGVEVVPPVGAVALKLRALSCFESQIEQPSTRPWFYELLDMREWLA